jgi:predicted nuclease with TOPRIM domain
MQQVAVAVKRVDELDKIQDSNWERMREIESILVNLREGMLSLKARLDDLAENNMMLENELRKKKETVICDCCGKEVKQNPDNLNDWCFLNSRYFHYDLCSVECVVKIFSQVINERKKEK